jgi:hypothetical protein
VIVFVCQLLERESCVHLCVCAGVLPGTGAELATDI